MCIDGHFWTAFQLSYSVAVNMHAQSGKDQQTEWYLNHARNDIHRSRCLDGCVVLLAQFDYFNLDLW